MEWPLQVVHGLNLNGSSQGGLGEMLLQDPVHGAPELHQGDVNAFVAEALIGHIGDVERVELGSGKGPPL